MRGVKNRGAVIQSALSSNSEAQAVAHVRVVRRPHHLRGVFDGPDRDLPLDRGVDAEADLEEHEGEEEE